ncbi:cysteine desulfurase [Candidatus Woesearchaeota archaeon]|nr:cysteine desulfurase [Candidatus Woesearchaeota archaeon]
MATTLSLLTKTRKDFPILGRNVNGKPLAYLDNAATSQKPRQVIEAISAYYENYNANIHRGIHRLSEEATAAYEEAHKKAAGLIGAREGEIIFTKNTTESLNLLAYSIGLTLRPGDEIVLTEAEHHSNLVPWQQVAKITQSQVKFAQVNEKGELDMEHFQSLVTRNTRIVAAAHVTNAFGAINPVKEMAEIAHSEGALMVVDAAQSVPHMPVSASQLGCDFIAFSSHKMLGPTGIGVLYGRKSELEKMHPFLYGGDMIKEVSYEETKFNELPWKFEAGTPNISGAIGFGAAIDYLCKIGLDSVQSHEQALTRHALKRLAEEKDVLVYGPEKRAGIISFNIGNVHPHDAAAILDMEGIAVRAGHHCAMPLMKKMGLQGTVRASFYLYNTKAEIGRLAEALEKVRKVFK